MISWVFYFISGRIFGSGVVMPLLEHSQQAVAAVSLGNDKCVAKSSFSYSLLQRGRSSCFSGALPGAAAFPFIGWGISRGKCMVDASFVVSAN